MDCPVFESFLTSPSFELIETKSAIMTNHDFERFVQNACLILKPYQNQTVQLKCPLHEKTFIALFALYRLNCKIILVHPKLPVEDYPVIDPLIYSFKQESKISLFKTSIDKAQFFFKTSGSTGNPKLIAHSMKTLTHSAKSTIAFYNMHQNTYHLNLPINHVGGFLIFFRMLLSMGKILIATEKKADFYSIVPTMLFRLLQTENLNGMNLEGSTFLVGGALISDELIEQSKKKGLHLSCTYGMTEMASQITAGQFNLGHPLLNKAIKIKQDQEILVQGNTLFLGYGLNPIKPSLENGFFPTNDLGRYDEKNGLIFIGRKDRMIIKGGENIHLENIERLIFNIQEIQAAICIGIPDKEYGEKIGCFIHPFEEILLKRINCLIDEKLGKFFTIDYFLPYPLHNLMKPTKKDLLSLAKEKGLF